MAEGPGSTKTLRLEVLGLSGTGKASEVATLQARGSGEMSLER